VTELEGGVSIWTEVWVVVVVWVGEGWDHGMCPCVAMCGGGGHPGTRRRKINEITHLAHKQSTNTLSVSGIKPAPIGRWTRTIELLQPKER